ncbi:sulfonate ABC transporter substrate-binding protein [Actinomycetospora sp. NBRC 106375]|uniref:ABC transporter substrate-binding protein n=1 Tax=Actinomycetospora sp. NBRC 106375 TaxID=3032207 RepID=UPI0024A51EE9|nr:ABC transporter substrate-binding protein [Actinomycetospora sp. NBRC 106375]GLZ49018.1 sulfonate ABC transporter substrate-binding protein [Actinomycetospora sp. NBRC 106375]
MRDRTSSWAARRGRSTILRILTVIALLGLTACSALGGPSSGGDPQTGGLERPTLRVGMLTIVDTASFYLAQERGFFRDEGLTVEPVTAQGGAASIPGLVGGSLDVAFGNYVSFFLAESQGVGRFRLISDGYQAAPNTFLLLARPDGSVRTPRDLAGRRVAVNTYRNIVELNARSALQTNGVDLASVQFVEVPFPDMAAALQSGRVDAAAMVEPFITSAERTIGAVPVLDTASGPTADIPVAGYGTTEEFARQNPRTVAAFQRAMARGQEAASDRRNVEQILPTYVRIDQSTASLINLGTFPRSLDATRLQRVGDLMLQFGLVPTRVDVAPLLATN